MVYVSSIKEAKWGGTMKRKRLLFVLNPQAGKGEIRPKLLPVIERFTAAGYDTTVVPTKQAGELPDTVERLGAAADLVVCCGGDGTLNETVTGLMRLEQPPPLGYLPTGTSNDFAAGLGIPHDLEAAAEKVVRGTPFDCDVGLFCHRYFTYIAAFGAFTDVSYQTPQQTKHWLGHTAYILEGIKRLPGLKSYHVSIQYDGGQCEGDYLFGMISNATSIGGMKLLPETAHVAMNDGEFEVVLIHNPHSLPEAQRVINAVLMHDLSSPLITAFHTAHITLRCTDAEMPWTLDGEYGGAPELVEIQNLRLGLRIML